MFISISILSVIPATPAENIATTGGYGLALLKMLIALVFVCALAYVVLRYGLARLHFKTGLQRSQQIKVEERHALGAGKMLWIVEVSGRRLLLGSSEGGMTLLAELDAPSGERGSGTNEVAFAAMLQKQNEQSEDSE